MEQYIPKSAVVAELERRIKSLHQVNSPREQAVLYECEDILSFLDTLEVKEVDFENYNKIKKVLSISFMNFLDNNRPENKMCLSNGECFDIEKAFDELDFAKLFRYMEKYLKA